MQMRIRNGSTIARRSTIGRREQGSRIVGFKILNLLLFLVIITSLSLCSAWEWSDYLLGGGKSTTSTPSSMPSFLSMDEISNMRVRDLRWHLARRHGYSADEIGRILDKKELIEALAYEEEKVRLQHESQQRRSVLWRGMCSTIFAIVVVGCWPLLRQAYEIVAVNVVVYIDRKRYEVSVCRELQSISGTLGFVLMFILDLLQLWLSLSVGLSWFVRRSKYFFPTPSLPLRPGQFLGDQVAQSSVGNYGINVGPMVVTWAMRYVHGKLEAWTGRALVRAQQQQRRQARQAETVEERTARREAKKLARDQAEVERQAARSHAQTSGRDANGTTPNSWMEPQLDADADVVSASQSHQAFLQQMEEYASPLDDLD